MSADKLTYLQLQSTCLSRCYNSWIYTIHLKYIVSIDEPSKVPLCIVQYFYKTAVFIAWKI